ncbi:O-acetylserine/cysteine exporter [Microvirga sp. KLBC 81]|uniref:EamA family transporter n=1 Tax=Microvirga sp. KLBC 81 TaxID=1862707 RepID=UPI000D52451E|nr:EamA family transporter [Microvirga sp. KLBC 81]PVE24756.1 O-acetylserine/cysteine exporter [Microvirga sp. KLBC 81]
MPLTHSLVAVLVAIIWGLSFVVIKLGVGSMPPLLLCALRFFFAALPAIFFVPRPKASWGNMVAYGFFLGVAQFGLLFAALAFGMPASLASLVMQAQVFFTILFAALFMAERPGPHQIMGGLIGFAGLVIIAVPRLSGSGGVPFLMTVAAAASWGVANIVSKRAGRVDMLGYIVWASLVAPLPLLGLSLLLDGPDKVVLALMNMDAGTWGAVAYLAYPTTVFAFGVWAYLLSRHPAATVTPFALLVPVAGILGSSLILGEAMRPVEAVGGAVIVAGLALNVFGARLLNRRRAA